MILLQRGVLGILCLYLFFKAFIKICVCRFKRIVLVLLSFNENLEKEAEGRTIAG